MAEVVAMGSVAGVREAIAGARLVEGAPWTTTWNRYSGAGRHVGEWAADAGAWRVAYDEWEWCEVIEGACELAGDDGVTWRFGAGDAFVIEPGWRGVWCVLEPMKKRYVIVEGA